MAGEEKTRAGEEGVDGRRSTVDGGGAADGRGSRVEGRTPPDDGTKILRSARAAASLSVARTTKIGWEAKSAPASEPQDHGKPAWQRVGQSLSAKLIILLVTAMIVIFALLGYANIRLHRQHLEATTLASAERVSDVIKRSTSFHML